MTNLFVDKSFMPGQFTSEPSVPGRRSSQLSSDGSAGVDNLLDESPTYDSFSATPPSESSSMSASASPTTVFRPEAPSRQSPSALTRLAPKYRSSQHEQQGSLGQTKRKGRFTCELCNATYPHRKNLREHKQTKHLRVRYTCDVAGCGASMAQKKNLARHKAKKHADDRLHSRQIVNLDLNMNR